MLTRPLIERLGLLGKNAAAQNPPLYSLADLLRL